MAYNDPYGFAKAAAPSSKGSGGYVDPYGLNGAGASAPASGGGGGIGGFLGKLGGGLVSAAEHTPAGVVAIGKAVGQDVLGQIEHPITPTHTSHTLPLLEAMGKQTKTDVSHPLRNPANTLLDVLGVASAGAGTVGRIAAAGKALSTAEDVGAAARVGGAAKALVTKPAPVTRLISHDGVSVELPAASNPLTRTFQKGVDKLRETFPNVPAVGAASVVGKETARGIRYEGQVARAPVDTLNKLAGDAGMLKHTPTGKLTADALARQHALRVAAEGVPTSERIAYHEGKLAEGFKSQAQNPLVRGMRESTFTGGHEEQIKLNQAAQKYLNESGAKPRVVDALAPTYKQMLKVAGNREALISRLGKLKDETIAGRLNAPGRIFKGAVYEQPSGRIAGSDEALRAELASTEKDWGKLVDSAMGGKPGDYKAVTAIQNAMAGKLARKGIVQPTVTDELRTQAEKNVLATMAKHPDDPAVKAWSAKLAKADAIRAELGNRADQSIGLAEGGGPPVGKLAGAEDFTGGEARVPTIPAFKGAKSPVVRYGSEVGLGEIKAPGSLTHAYEGAAYAGGKIRNDVVRMMSESALEAQKYWTLLHVGDKLKAAAKDLPQSKHDIPFVTEHLPGRPSLVETRARLADESALPGEMANLSHGYEGLRSAIFPSYSKDATGAIHMAEPVPGVKWIDERLLGGLNKPSPIPNLSASAAAKTVDAINNAEKLAILYLKPAYLAANLLSNVAAHFVEAGFAAPAYLTKAALLWRRADPEVVQNVLAAMGEGYSGSLDATQIAGGRLTNLLVNPTAKAAHFAAGMWAKPVDALPRIASFLYEARRDGVSTVADLRSLFNDPAQADKLEQVMRRANAAMIDFGNLNRWEQSVIRRVVFFYPWVKGSATWLGKFPIEHPVGAGLTSPLGEVGVNEQSSALGQYVPSWAEGLIPVGTGAHGLPQTIDPFTVTPFDTSGKLAQSLGEFLSGHPKLAASSVPDMLSPAAGIVGDLVQGKGVKTAGQDLYANLPFVTAIEQAGGKGSKTYPYEGTWQQALARYLAGTGFVPRETDTQTLEKSYQNARKPSRSGGAKKKAGYADPYGLSTP